MITVVALAVIAGDRALFWLAIRGGYITARKPAPPRNVKSPSGTLPP